MYAFFRAQHFVVVFVVVWWYIYKCKHLIKESKMTRAKRNNVYLVLGSEYVFVGGTDKPCTGKILAGKVFSSGELKILDDVSKEDTILITNE